MKQVKVVSKETGEVLESYSDVIEYDSGSVAIQAGAGVMTVCYGEPVDIIEYELENIEDINNVDDSPTQEEYNL